MVEHPAAPLNGQDAWWDKDAWWDEDAWRNEDAWRDEDAWWDGRGAAHQMLTEGSCAAAVSTVLSTLEEVHVMVGTRASDSALVRSEVLMYTTCRLSGTLAACNGPGGGVLAERTVCNSAQAEERSRTGGCFLPAAPPPLPPWASASSCPARGVRCRGSFLRRCGPWSSCAACGPPSEGATAPPLPAPLPTASCCRLLPPHYRRLRRYVQFAATSSVKGESDVKKYEKARAYRLTTQQALLVALRLRCLHAFLPRCICATSRRRGALRALAAGPPCAACGPCAQP